ncbi:hypothetical protein HY212_05060 [Candidatus Pacearchaeota archaeon]|nr:hypothetical protein [Candidatus Pacearchaeota archaeon]
MAIITGRHLEVLVKLSENDTNVWIESSGFFPKLIEAVFDCVQLGYVQRENSYRRHNDRTNTAFGNIPPVGEAQIERFYVDASYKITIQGENFLRDILKYASEKSNPPHHNSQANQEQ